jgi:23S rRNA (uracil1939-C5)-methyltransferase
VWFRNPKDCSASLGGREILLRGDPVIYESIAGLQFKVSPTSFMQTNSAQAEVLYGTMMEFASPTGKETAFDLYSGTGPIALMLARQVGHVYALESNPAAVADARENAALNKITNVEFVQGEVEKSLAELSSRAAPELVVVDPPRPGLHKKAMKSLIDAEPRKIVYVSCNPSTLARDAALLIEAGWQLKRVRPVDMFPHTYHIECVSEFVRE